MLTSTHAHGLLKSTISFHINLSFLLQSLTHQRKQNSVSSTFQKWKYNVNARNWIMNNCKLYGSRVNLLCRLIYNRSTMFGSFLLFCAQEVKGVVNFYTMDSHCHLLVFWKSKTCGLSINVFHIIGLRGAFLIFLVAWRCFSLNFILFLTSFSVRHHMLFL